LLLVPTALLGWLLVDFMRGAWGAGIHGGDRSVAKGINYARALALVQNDLSFLGTSAVKLTGEVRFRKAIMQCRPDRPIRFLLMQPDDANLIRAAQRFQRDPAAYRENAIGSLRRLQDLRINQGVENLEVRFYDTAVFEPIFRLMFIDEGLCLASFNVYGRGDGSELPQLHVVAASDASRSFYFAFDRYFSSLWERSACWDFQEYL
jgi:hypothetical protein